MLHLVLQPQTPCPSQFQAPLPQSMRNVHQTTLQERSMASQSAPSISLRPLLKTYTPTPLTLHHVVTPARPTRCACQHISRRESGVTFLKLQIFVIHRPLSAKTFHHMMDLVLTVRSSYLMAHADNTMWWSVLDVSTFDAWSLRDNILYPKINFLYT